MQVHPFCGGGTFKYLAGTTLDIDDQFSNVVQWQVTFELGSQDTDEPTITLALFGYQPLPLPSRPKFKDLRFDFHFGLTRFLVRFLGDPSPWSTTNQHQQNDMSKWRHYRYLVMAAKDRVTHSNSLAQPH